MTVVALSGVTGALLVTPASAGSVLVVNGGSATCSDSGPATAAEPLCRLSAAAARAGAGDEVLVQPGVYRETLDPIAGGAAGAPVVYRAGSPGVVIDGSDDLSDPARWTATGDGSWTTSFTATPAQVFVDGSRLVRITSGAVPAGGWTYDPVSDVLTVHTDGTNPAAGHAVAAGARTYGVRIDGLSHVVIDGFEIRRQNSNGAVLFTGSTDVHVMRLAVTQTGSHGIRCEGCQSSRITASDVATAGSLGILVKDATGVSVLDNRTHDNDNHGIALQGTSASLVSGNESFANARPTVRAAVGIDINAGSLDNVVERNRVHHNQDSGIAVYNGSHNTLVRRNASWANGDHGFDTLASQGTRYINNTSYGNAVDGISVEGGSTGTRVANTISAASGNRALYVDAASVPGFVSNYDVLWHPVSGTILVEFDGVQYATVSAFAKATGHESKGTNKAPQFVNAAAGDLRLKKNSAGIDAADAGVPGFAPADLTGALPFDVKKLTDTGAGTPRYADRGAYEFRP